MNRDPHKLTAADRAELCRRVDMLALLQSHGVNVRRNGRAYLCKLRPDEKTPSCHVYPPGIGRKGSGGWTLKDYGDGWGGDALAYLVDRRGLPFVDALGELCRLAGWTPPSLQKDRVGCPTKPPKGGGLCGDTPPTPPACAPPCMPPADQCKAACAFISGLLELWPDAAEQGDAYLESRGCLHPALAGAGCYLLPTEICMPLAVKLAAGPDADLLTRAGLLKPAEAGRLVRLAWWDRVALLPCHDAEGCLAYIVGRRLDWNDLERFGKYINQTTAGGAVRWPFNLPALYRAGGRMNGWPDLDKAGDVLLVEGALDALGAAVLGWPAVALLTRLQAFDYTDRQGAAARMLEAHLPALRDVRRVRVVPDADAGQKGAEGEAMAAGLAAQLRFNGVRADVVTLPELGAPADCKDLADWAKKTKGTL